MKNILKVLDAEIAILKADLKDANKEIRILKDELFSIRLKNESLIEEKQTLMKEIERLKSAE